MIRVNRPREELAEAIAAEGPYDLIVDYLWGAPAEAVFAALTRVDPRADDAPERIRYIQVAAGEISLDIDPVPLAKVEQVWPQAGSDRRLVFVP